MRPALALLLLLSLLPAAGHSWRAWSRFHLGAEANAVGGAYAGDAANETAMFYNPAGMVQLKPGFSGHWEAATGVRVQDILGRIDVKLDRLDSFSFFGLAWNLGAFRLGTSIASEFYSSLDSTKELNVRVGAFSAAYPVLENLALGFSIGPVFGSEQTGWAVSYAWSAGLLWKVSGELQAGACWHSGFELNWNEPAGLVSLSENYPALFEAGGVLKLAKHLLFNFGFDYLDIDSIRYTVNGIHAPPVFDGGFFTRVHPHLGFQFLEPVTGARLAAGFMTDSVLFDGGSIPQFLLTAGFRFYGNNVVFSGSLIDSVLIGLFYPGNERDEKINLAFSYQFF